MRGDLGRLGVGDMGMSEGVMGVIRPLLSGSLNM